MKKQFLHFCSAIKRQAKGLTRELAQWSFILITGLFLTGCDGSLTIVNDLEERDANEIIVFLAGHRIDVEKMPKIASAGSTSAPSWNIAVKKTDRMRALTLLNNNGLPRRRAQNLLNLFEKQGLVSSELEERIRYQSGLAAQIASTIRKIDGVLDADVQISFPQEDSTPGKGQDQSSITASVYVKHQGVLDNPNSHLVLKIKRLVASAIPGLDFENVTVVSDRAVFNDPLSLTLSKDPEAVTVWGIRVFENYALTLQLLLISLSGLSGLLLILFGWMVWKVLPLLPAVGGFSSLFRLSPWHLPVKEEAPEVTSTEAAPKDAAVPTPGTEKKT